MACGEFDGDLCVVAKRQGVKQQVVDSEKEPTENGSKGLQTDYQAMNSDPFRDSEISLRERVFVRESFL